MLEGSHHSLWCLQRKWAKLGPKCLGKICSAFPALALPKIFKYFDHVSFFRMDVSTKDNVSRQPVLGKLGLSSNTAFPKMGEWDAEDFAPVGLCGVEHHEMWLHMFSLGQWVSGSGVSDVSGWSGGSVGQWVSGSSGVETSLSGTTHVQLGSICQWVRWNSGSGESGGSGGVET